MKRKAQNTMCLEGFYYLIVLCFIVGGAFFRQINLLFVLAGMMIGPLVYNWRMVMSMMRGLTVRRQLPRGICAGDLLVVEFIAERDKSWVSTWASVVKDRVVRLAPGNPTGKKEKPQQPETFFPYIGPGDSVVESYRGRLHQRGKYQFGPLEVSTRFPLGLIRRTVRFPQVEELIVCPRLGRLTRQWSDVSHAAMHGSSPSRRQQGLVEGDFYGLRDWRSGDSRRWIHWRTSARRNSLAVRQFDQPRLMDLVLVLELWQPEKPTPADLERVEQVVSFAATVAEDVCRSGGGQILIAVAGGEQSIKQGSLSRALLQEIMEQLAVAEASSDDMLPLLLNEAIEKSTRGSRLVVVSTRGVDPADTNRFAEAWQHPANRRRLQRARCIDASQGELQELITFQPAPKAAADVEISETQKESVSLQEYSQPEA